MVILGASDTKILEAPWSGYFEWPMPAALQLGTGEAPEILNPVNVAATVD
jgi:hypothetical protein